MSIPLSSKSIKGFLDARNFIAEPVYVLTPTGEVIQLTKMSQVELFDEDGNSEGVFPVFAGEETDISVVEGNYLLEPNAYLPPS